MDAHELISANCFQFITEINRFLSILPSFFEETIQLNAYSSDMRNVSKFAYPSRTFAENA